MANKDNELHIVTEVGTFGELNIEDPTKKKVAKKDEDVDALIKEAISENSRNLTNK